MNVTATLLQTLCFIGGTIVVYFAAFSYEGEDATIQDSLESWWIRLHDLEGGLLSKAKALLMKSNEIVDNFLSRLFGKKIFSVRFISTSTTLSFVIFGPLVLIFLSLGSPDYILYISLPIAFLFGAFLLWRGLLPLRTGKAPIIVSTILIISLFLPLLALLDNEYNDDVEWLLILLGLLSLICDAVVTLVVRVLLLAFGSRWPLIFVAIVPASVWISIAVLSVLSIFVLGPFSWILLPVMNLPSIFFASLVLLIPLILIIGKVSFNAICRVLYSFQRHGLIYNKKVLWSVALFLFSGVPFLRPALDFIENLGL